MSSYCLFPLPEECSFSDRHWAGCDTFASVAVPVCSQECKVLEREGINQKIYDLMIGHSVGKWLLLLVLASIMNVSYPFIYTSGYFTKKCLSSTVCRCLSFCKLFGLRSETGRVQDPYSPVTSKFLFHSAGVCLFLLQ